MKKQKLTLNWFIITFLVLFLSVVFFGIMNVQADDDQKIDNTSEKMETEMMFEKSVNESGEMQSVEQQVETTTFVQEKIEAPSSGPAETVIIMAAILFGLLGAVIFLALIIQERHL